MELRSEDGLAVLGLSIFEVSLPPLPLPAVGIYARAMIDGFGGTQRAWFELADIARFAHELEGVHKGVADAAVLDSMNTGELQLTIVPGGRVGPVVAHVRIQSRRQIEGRPYPSSMEASFGFPRERLVKLAVGFWRWTDQSWLRRLESAAFDEHDPSLEG